MQTIEATIVILTPIDHDPISIVSIYIPLRSDEYTFTIDIENLIQTSSNCVLFGDFNAPHTAWNCNTNSSRGVRLLDFVNMTNLYIAYPNSPTRFGINSANTLDIAVIRNFYYPYTINSLHDLSSDHNPVLLNFTLKLKKDTPNPRAVHTNWPLFSKHLNTKLSLFNYHPNSIKTSTDIDQKISEFTETVRAAHSHASRPIETLRKSYTPPYIHNLIKQKNQYRNLFHRTLDPHYKTLYNRAQKNVKKALRKYSNENWTARLKALDTQDNSLWAVQKFLKNKRSDIPPLNCSSGTAVTDTQKANILAESILDNFTENSRPNNDYDDVDELINNTVNSFLSLPTSTTTETAYPSEIISYIEKSNSKKAPGKDGISNRMTKNFSLKAILILTILINKILTLNYFPKAWKEAIIFPILKPDQEEMDDSSPSKSCKGNSSVPQSMNTSPEHSYSAPVPRRSLVVKNLENNEKGFQFSKKTSSFQKQSLQSISTQSFGANYHMKNCQDDDVPDNVKVKVNQLEKLHHQFATVNRHFSPLSPLPPTPPPKIIVSKYNQPSKDLTAINPCTASVSSNQRSVTSNNQILQVTKAPSSSTPRKNQFCHQQSKGFEIPSEQLHDTSNLNPEDSKNGALNVTSSDSPNYINLNAERVDNGLSLKFDVPSQLHLGIDLNSMHISYYIRNNQESSSKKNSSSLPSEVSLINEQSRDVKSHLYEGRYKKKPKGIIESPSSRGSFSEVNEFFSKDFPSIERLKRVFTVNHDISVINTSDEDILRKEPSINFSQSSANDCHNLETNVRSQIQSFENRVEHSRSSSSESLLPLKKKLKISESPQQYEKSPLENEVRLSNFALETTKTSHNVHMDQTDVQLKCNSEQKASDSFNALNVIDNIYDSTSKSEITSSLESKKIISKNSTLKRRNNLSPSNETLSSISNCTDDYVTELETESDYANGENETMSEMDRDQDFL
ncbi:probable RNA-directed DNA polymerase from transposon BS [Trichonephila clavipes]|nr:probable RNA-directed DNA polymerase from transposon BS [Trichonephila clavipes]